MPKKVFKQAAKARQDFVSKLLDDLQSRGVVEKLRLECVADVKTKSTYLELKERMRDYVTNKMSSKKWMSDDTFREQVVECGVLALTVERVVDEVVSRKLREQIRPLIIELIKEYGDKKTCATIRHEQSKSPSGSTLGATAKTVRTICSDTKRVAKRVLGGGLIAYSLAAASHSRVTESDEENNNNSESENELFNHNEAEKDEESKTAPVIKTEPDDTHEETPVTSSYARRERKLNSKYSEMYFTSFPSQPPPPPSPAKSTPVITQAEAQKLNSSPQKTMRNSIIKQSSKRKFSASADSEDEEEHSEKKVVVHDPPRKLSAVVKRNGRSSPTEVTAKKSQVEYKEDKEIKSVIRNDRAEKPARPFPMQNGHHKVAVESYSQAELSNGSIRKSGRQRKVNSIIFWDTLSPNSPKEPASVIIKEEPPVNKLRSSRSISDDMDTLVTEVQKKNEVFAVKSTVPALKLPVPVLKSPVPALRSPVLAVSKPITPVLQSGKRYDSSDLYKPRLTNFSSSRMKNMF